MPQDLKISLIPQRPDHAEGLYEALTDPRIHTFLDGEPPASVEAVRQRIETLQQGGPADASEIWLNWTVFKEGTIVGFTQATIEHAGCASIAYAFRPEVWGTGVAQNAAELMLSELKKHHGVCRFEADTELGNLASQSLLTRLGFIETHREGGEVFYTRDR